MQFELVHITSLFENATEGFVVTNSKGSIILVNPSACRMFEYEAEELIGQKIEILVPTQYQKRHVKLRDDFYNDPRNRVMGHGRDLHGLKKSGINFPVEVSLSTYLESGERYVIAFIIDITHRKEIEKSMVRQQEQLEHVSNEMRRLNAELEAKVEERTIILKEALQRLEQSQEELSEALDKERQLNEIKPVLGASNLTRQLNHAGKRMMLARIRRHPKSIPRRDTIVHQLALPAILFETLKRTLQARVKLLLRNVRQLRLGIVNVINIHILNAHVP